MDKYKNVACLKQYSQKNKSEFEILNHLYFCPNFVTALRSFSLFLIFRCRPAMVADIFTPVCHHERSSYGPNSTLYIDRKLLPVIILKLKQVLFLV